MDVTLVERYNPAWPSWFAQIRDVVAAALGDVCLAIEHVGSTAAPGMPAKPIIDLFVVIAAGRFEEVKERLGRLGYVHEGDLGITEREAFDLVDAELKARLPRHHLYVCAEDNEELRRVRAFRDFLKEHGEYVEELSELKWRLAEEHENNKQAYMDGKSDLVRHITELALQQV